MPTPKAAKASADTHREEEDDSDEEVAAIPPGMEERDGGGGAGDDTPSSGAGGSLTNIMTNKKVLLLLAGLAAAFVAYRYYQKNGSPVDISQKAEEVTPDGDDVEERKPQRPNIKKDPSDPLKADAEAFSWVFGDQAEADANPPGE